MTAHQQAHRQPANSDVTPQRAPHRLPTPLFPWSLCLRPFVPSPWCSHPPWCNVAPWVQSLQPIGQQSLAPRPRRPMVQPAQVAHDRTPAALAPRVWPPAPATQPASQTSAEFSARRQRILPPATHPASDPAKPWYTFAPPTGTLLYEEDDTEWREWNQGPRHSSPSLFINNGVFSCPGEWKRLNLDAGNLGPTAFLGSVVGKDGRDRLVGIGFFGGGRGDMKTCSHEFLPIVFRIDNNRTELVRTGVTAGPLMLPGNQLGTVFHYRPIVLWTPHAALKLVHTGQATAQGLFALTWTCAGQSGDVRLFYDLDAESLEMELLPSTAPLPAAPQTRPATQPAGRPAGGP
jgi:hypothetical protein